MTKQELEARELSKRPLKSDEILNLDIPEISGLSTKALKKLASTLVSSSNKRIRRLLNAAPKGISESALRASGVLTQKATETNPDEVDVRFFSVKDKTRNEIIREVRRMMSFQKMKTSTVKGAIEVRQMNERNVFGETREEKAKRERALDRERKRLSAKLKKAKTPEEKEELEKRAREIEEKYKSPAGVVTGDFPERTGMARDDVLQEVFKFYRGYEDSHAQIIKDLGSDKVLKAIGAYTTGLQKPFGTREEFADYINDTLPSVIQSEWEELPATEDLMMEFFNAFEDYQKTGEEDFFTEENGWF